MTTRDMDAEIALAQKLAADPIYAQLRARLDALRQLCEAYERATATGALDPPPPKQAIDTSLRSGANDD